MSLDSIGYAKEFAALVDEVALKRREFNAPLVVGQTSEVLLSLGCVSLPVLMPASVVNKAREKHGVSIEDIKTLPRQIREPVMIFESDTQPNAVNVLTDFLNREGKPVTIAIHFDVPIVWHRAHKVATISERNESQIELWKRNGLVRYANPEKQKALTPITGLQLPGEGSTPKEYISQKSGIVNNFFTPSDQEVNKSARGQEKQKARTQSAGLQLPGEGSTPKGIVAQDVAREATQNRLNSRTDLSSETKKCVSEFLKRPEAGKIWKSQTLDPDGRIAVARLIGGESSFEQATKDLPEIQHGVVRALARAYARGQDRGPQCSL